MAKRMLNSECAPVKLGIFCMRQGQGTENSYDTEDVSGHHGGALQATKQYISVNIRQSYSMCFNEHYGLAFGYERCAK